MSHTKLMILLSLLTRPVVPVLSVGSCPSMSQPEVRRLNADRCVSVCGDDEDLPV